MKALIAALALIASPAVAQEWQCAPRDDVVAGLARNFGENRRAAGLGWGDSLVMELFASDKTGSWTLATTNPEGVTCLIASGRGFDGDAVPLPPEGVDG